MYKLLFLACLYVCVSNADYNDQLRMAQETPSEAIASSLEQKGLDELRQLTKIAVVECDTDSDCLEKNPDIEPY